MACDRLNWRALLISVCIVGLASTAGCLRSSLLRPAVEPVLEPQSPAEQEPDANERSVIPTGTGAPKPVSAHTASLAAGAASLATPLTSVATPALSEPGPSALSGAAKSGASVPLPPDPSSALTPSPNDNAAHPGPVAPAKSSAGTTGGSSQPPAPLPTDQSPAASSTPLLDAAIQRVEALTRQQRESLGSTDPADEREKKSTRLSANTNSAQAATMDSAPPLPIVLARPAESTGSTGTTKRQVGSTPQLPPGQRPAPVQRGDHPLDDPAPSLLELRRESKTSSGSRGSPPAEFSPGPMPATETRAGPKNPSAPLQVAAENVRPDAAREENSHLNVANLQLCRRVNGFGSFEPLGGTTVRPGQRVLLYCEMTGLRYEATDAGFTSRVASRVELRAANSKKVLWEQELGIARDVCSRVRHDYYVSYRFTFPRSLPAGPHRLRVVQTDLAANRSTSSEVLLTIAP